MVGGKYTERVGGVGRPRAHGSRGGAGGACLAAAGASGAFPPAPVTAEYRPGAEVVANCEVAVRAPLQPFDRVVESPRERGFLPRRQATLETR